MLGFSAAGENALPKYLWLGLSELARRPLGRCVGFDLEGVDQFGFSVDLLVQRCIDHSVSVDQVDVFELGGDHLHGIMPGPASGLVPPVQVTFVDNLHMLGTKFFFKDLVDDTYRCHNFFQYGLSLKEVCKVTCLSERIFLLQESSRNPGSGRSDRSLSDLLNQTWVSFSFSFTNRAPHLEQTGIIPDSKRLTRFFTLHAGQGIMLEGIALIAHSSNPRVH